MNINRFSRKNKAFSTLFVLVFMVVGIFFLKSTAAVFAPIVFAVMISFMLFPVMQKMEKHHIPRILAVIIIMSVLAVVVYFIVIIAQNSFNLFINNYPRYLQQFQEIYYDFSNKLIEKFELQVQPDIFASTNWPRLVQTYVISFSSSISKMAGYTLLIFIFMFFLFLEYPYLNEKIKDAFSFREAKKFNIISTRILYLVGRYFFVKLIISLLTGLEVWGLLKLLGVDFALVWGGIAFALNFVPTVGSTVVVILISIQGIVQFYPDVFMPTVVFLLNLGVQQLMGNLIEPRIQGSNLNLSPVLILISLAFWAWVWGPLGAVLAVPITVMLRVVFSYFDSTRFISILMSTGYSKKKR
ncbi:MAG: AI-2E family transporter [Spirochaetia bacterium]|nr:AI-2E family transporter [Spirochaetales bacterium]MBR4797594.1 AI-2E family transporter [Spirochaetia bacterium]MBR5927074.1 AI-2E family transporter [Spirochaetia bacterium]